MIQCVARIVTVTSGQSNKYVWDFTRLMDLAFQPTTKVLSILRRPLAACKNKSKAVRTWWNGKWNALPNKKGRASTQSLTHRGSDTRLPRQRGKSSFGNPRRGTPAHPSPPFFFVWPTLCWYSSFPFLSIRHSVRSTRNQRG